MMQGIITVSLLFLWPVSRIRSSGAMQNWEATYSRDVDL